MQVYICGSAGPWDEYNPLYVARQGRVLDVMYLLAERPMSVEELASELEASRAEVEEAVRALRRIDAVREEGGRLRANFVVLLKEDVIAISEAAKGLAEELARDVARLWPKLEEVLSGVKCAAQVGVGKVAFAVVGAYALDIMGLEILRERKLAVCETPKPGGRRYTLYAREVFSGYKTLISGLYWGCHWSVMSGYGFYSFGDASGARRAIPDVSLSRELLRAHDWEVEAELRAQAARVLLRVLERGAVSKSSLAASQLEARLVDALTSMGYLVGGCCLRLSSPAFSVADNARVSEALRLLRPVVGEHVARGRGALSRELAGITPLRQGLPIELMYTELWHWVFGRANRLLAEWGYFHNPRPKRPGEGRYLAWVHEQPPPPVA